uniref:Uncharacterized protein n=1 Tax=Trichobilharzia regenti TaxID=157069 RepID=A0AA85JZY1_TRIRE|nr:unnamed protein product [Trichobilharzia regenti]
MSDYKSVASKLDHNAEEFVPLADLQEKTYSEIRITVESVFDADFSSSQASLKKVRAVAELNSAKASRLVGEILAELTTLNVKRVGVGCRCLKDVRAHLPVTKGNEVEAAVFNRVKSMTQEVISSNILKSFMLSSQKSISNSSRSDSEICVESGDVPKEPENSSIEHIFALVTFLRYLITNLNTLDDCEGYVSAPPIQPCIDFCLLLNTVCELQLHSERTKSSEPKNEASLSLTDTTCALLSESSWNSLMYNLFDGFSQGLMHFNLILTSTNVRVLDGTWQRTCSIDERENDFENNQDFTSASHLSMLINKCLTSLRALLVEEQLPMRILRSTVLDLLMYASEMAAVQNASGSNWTEPNNFCEEMCPDINLSNESLEELNEEQAADFQRFLKDTGQLS